MEQILKAGGEVAAAVTKGPHDASAVHSPVRASLPLRIKGGWALGEIGLASYVAILAMYLLYFMTDVLHISAAYAGVLLLIPRVWNIVIDPIVGQISDRTSTRYGRRRPFLIGGAALWGIGFALIFSMPRLDGGWLFGLAFLAVFLITNTGLSIYQVPYCAMATEMTEDYAERISLVSWKNVVARLSVLGGVALAPRVVQLMSVPADGYRLMGMVFGSVILISGIVAFWATSGARSTTSHRKEPATLREQLAATRANRPFLVLIFSYAIYFLGQLPFVGLLVYYVTVVLGQSAALVGVLFPIASLTSAIVTPLWAKAAERFGKRRMCMLSWGGAGLAWTAPLFIPDSMHWLIYPAMVVVGIFQAGGDLLPSAMVPDVVDVDELVSGERREGAIYGLWVSQQQTVLALGGLVTGLALAIIGYDGHVEHAGPGIGMGIRIAMTLPSCALAFLAVACLTRYHLPEAELQAMRQKQVAVSGRENA
ncbi:MFS transporter [Dyella amyloliquefaciens]|uniref:MFS transporter n=1 Tax=Dyella amyloliquefaciens TaxID=1770545 RepID=UPI00197AC16B|nr:MFS transporter [Dyella amyloliquefaciens]